MDLLEIVGYIFLGALITLILIRLFSPIDLDCGCGAMSSMCGQCIRGGNLSAPICGAFL